ncbi:MAG: sporulation protein YqfC [Solirubrobacterales bacterium]
MSKKTTNERIGRALSDVLDLPRDLVLDLPRVTMIGQHDFHIEKHRGLMEYETNLVRISLARGYLEIEGEELEIRFIMQDELSISGLIRNLRFVE